MYADPAALVAMAPSAIQPQGNSMPHSNMAPSLAMSFIIAVEGIFPSFN
jgi:microcystin-dependent protein